MALSYKFAVIRVIPDARRGERVNIGVVVFQNGSLDVRILPSLAKVTAISGAVDVNLLRSLPDTMSQWTSALETVEQKHEALTRIGIVTVSELGSFEIAGVSAYELAVARTMKALVSVPPQRRDLPSGQRIKTSLRERFRKQGILGGSETDIANHLVVPNYPIDPAEGLYADFALKNRHYHITETTDFRATSASNLDHFKAASFTAIKLDKAKQNFPGKVMRFVVYASKGNPAALQQQVNLMGDYADEIYNLASRQEMAHYMEHIMQAASHTTQLVRQ